MNVDDFLLKYELLYRNAERAYNDYLEALDAEIYPGAPSITLYAKGSGKRGSAVERVVLKTENAATRYQDAAKQFKEHHTILIAALHELKKTDPAESNALELVYIRNINKPFERRYIGVCKALKLRTRREIPAAMTTCKRHLAEILARKYADSNGR